MAAPADGPAEPAADPPMDGRTDVPADSPVDATADMPQDAGMDVAVDLHADLARDATPDTPIDAAADAGSPPPDPGFCCNVLQTTIAGYETAVVARARLVGPDVAGVGQVELATAWTAPDRLEIVAGFSLVEPVCVPGRVRRYEAGLLVEDETVACPVVTFDLLATGDRARGHVRLVLDDGRTIAGCFEALADGATCRHRRCLEGETYESLVADCCCAGEILGPGQSCAGYAKTTSKPEPALAPCNGFPWEWPYVPCPGGEICRPEPADGTARFCRGECGSNADCPITQVCVDGACRPLRCDEPADCGADRDCVAPAPGAARYCSGQDMGALDECLPYLDSHGAYCARPCKGFSDCGSGWVCDAGFCAPDCTDQGCPAVADDFERTMAEALACVPSDECVGHYEQSDLWGSSYCGLWQPYWEYCSPVVHLGPGADEALLGTLNDRWLDACANPWHSCPACDNVPMCWPACEAGVCTGNCQ